MQPLFCFVQKIHKAYFSYIDIGHYFMYYLLYILYKIGYFERGDICVRH